jgi:hypothetical protein
MARAYINCQLQVPFKTRMGGGDEFLSPNMWRSAHINSVRVTRDSMHILTAMSVEFWS